MHRHGAFNLQLAFSFFSSFGQPRPEPITEWPDRFDPGTPDGYDFFLGLGPLGNAIERQNPGVWNVLVMGPWPHGGWTRTAGRSLGEADFGFETGEYYVQEVELPFFRHFLKVLE